MEPRLDYGKVLPEAMRSIYALDRYSQNSGLEPSLLELTKLRASQLNGCAYCVQLHTATGRELGIPEAKLTLIVTWREAGIFSEREQAALAWAEELTLLAERHVPDAAYEAAREVFTELELAGLTAVIATINVWNRIAVTYRYAPEV